MHLCPQEIMAVVGVFTMGAGAVVWLRWKWQVLLRKLSTLFQR